MRLFALSCVLLALVGCGKKGPPLTPFVRIPAAVAPGDVRRVGDDVYVSFTVPAQNLDLSKPADVRRIEVYAVTIGEPRSPNRILEGADLVTVVNVAAAGAPGTPLPPAPPPGTPPPPERALPLQGDVVTVQERLEPAAFIAQPLPALPGRPVRTPALPPGVPPPEPPPPPKPQRAYVVVAFSAHGRPGPRGTPLIVQLDRSPAPPADVSVTFSATGVSVTWEPSGGLLGFLVDRQRPLEALPLDEDAPRRVASAVPTDIQIGPTRYNVYGRISADPLVLPSKAVELPRWQRRPARPLNAQPLETFQFTDAVEFERERCYEIRAVRGTGTATVEGAPSLLGCVHPVDIYPPDPPSGVSAVVSEGAISLIWEASPSDDVAGYVVLRGESPGDTLLPVTPVPVTETRFVDRMVVPGVRYVYAVLAVDGRVPLPNESAPSPRVEETAR
jgi:predicted small lipoprotein YifL